MGVETGSPGAADPAGAARAGTRRARALRRDGGAARAARPAADRAAPPPDAPLVALRLSDRLADDLVRRIESGALRVGDRLPTEAQLAATHGVSRSVVREAVQRVKARGLLHSRQGSGVFVAAPPMHQPLAFDPTVLDSMDAVIQVVELRRVLEGEMAALAAQRSTRAQQAVLRRAVKAIDLATSAGRDGVREDLAFHKAIGEATGNPQFGRLLAFLEQYLYEAMRVTKGNEARDAEFMRQVREEHRRIIDAVARRDPAAAREAAIAHLRNGEQRLVQGGVIASGDLRGVRASAARDGAAPTGPAARVGPIVPGVSGVPGVSAAQAVPARATAARPATGAPPGSGDGARRRARAATR